LEAALALLESKDLVVGPAVDGGYYLLGQRRFAPELFRDIPWGTSRVLETTLGVARQSHLSWAALETLHDLDRPEDLHVWAQSVPGTLSGQGRISVVILVRNEAAKLQAVLEAAAREQPHEIIVVDGGSTDETIRVARALGAIVLSVPPCRAVQMNRGAAIATGEFLLFLHADTRLSAGYATHVFTTLAQPGVVVGAFTFALDADFPGRRLIETTTRWRGRLWQMPYGDQGLFLRRELFLKLAGFPEIPILEDYEFVRRLRRLGRVAIVPARAVTSARRWQQCGVIRTTLLNKVILLAYRLSVSPGRLAAWYQRDLFDPQPMPVSGSSETQENEPAAAQLGDTVAFDPRAETCLRPCTAQTRLLPTPKTKLWE
jgi:rSAM/selenodomain-associated transferase 2